MFSPTGKITTRTSMTLHASFHDIVDVLSDDEDQDYDDIVYTLTPVDLELLVAAWEVHCELITL